MNSQSMLASGVRSILQAGGAYIVEHGLASQDQMQAVIGGLLALAGVIWGQMRHAQLPKGA